VTVVGSAPQVAAVGLTPSGTPVTITPATGGNVTQGVAEAPTLPSATLTIPAGALPGSAPMAITLTPVVNQPGDALVSAASVRAQAIGDVSVRGPEIEARMTPAGTVMTAPGQLTMPLPFALTPGMPVPILQFTDGQWRETGVATVDPSGTTATGHITALVPTGLDCWHAFDRTTTQMSPVTLQEMSLSEIQNNINNLLDRHYCVDRVVEAGRTAEITARFRWQFPTVDLPASPVDEMALCLGPAAYRDVLSDFFASGQWNIAGGPVTFNVFQENVTVNRIVDGVMMSVAGTFVANHGRPSWALPTNHNQGGVN
jgi:hypothetical protein